MFAAHLIKRGPAFFSSKPSPIHGRIVFYIGTLLPDLLSRPWYILFPPLKDWVIAMHTPMGALLTFGILASFFEPHFRRSAFLNLCGGGALHFFLDAFQKQILGNNFWLFPFSWKDFGFDVFWAGDVIPFVPLWIFLFIAIEILFYLIRGRRTKEPIL
jgi:hypothetical protein